MALFQNSVPQKHLKLQEQATIEKAYKKFTKYFHDRAIQKNIRESKEEQFQEGFLRELFVNVLGYTLNPNPNFNLTTELKNEKNAKKTDGAIIKDGNALAVIELKSTKTKDLGLVQEQAFNYKANQTGCIYVITSNFEKVRFYINNAVDFEEFNLFKINQEQFALMYLCLQKDNLLNNIPLNIMNDSIVEEEKITKTFYTDYSLFKRELYRDLVKKNVKNSVFRSELEREDSERGTKNIKLNLFKKSQKLIDRFLFIFFAEDRGLLSPNSTIKILEQWDKLNDLDAYKPLYERFQLYFNYLDTGRKGTDKSNEIFAYNGGLFKPDTVLDSLEIDDELLYKHAKKLSAYDFDSQVDVNILGHIFENSLNEIESVNAEIEGGEFDKQKTKRKKDGVFYTPKYITKYIVDNTVGKLCKQKRAELGIVEEDFVEGRQLKTKEKLLKNLKAYREWLLQITICDPACGSGAFLNQALDFLIYEHQNIDLLENSLLGGLFVFPNIENTVLENNIFGVDLNEESVEIAKLSLWLRTAQPRRKLNDLNNNIQCGNSLIDDKKVAGDKAFNWQEKFPKVFKTKDKQAFHVVLTTHNSRTSTRMITQNVQKGPAKELVLEEEITLTKIIGEIITENNYNCIAYNICKDHIHLVLVCEYEELTEIVKTIKGKSSFLFNKKSNGLKPIGGNDPNSSNGFQPIAGNQANQLKINENLSLWSQKFYSVATNTWELETLSKKAGYIYNDSHFDNVLPYIQNNREKHGLPVSKELNTIIEDFTVSQEIAYKIEDSGGFDVIIGNPPYVLCQPSNTSEILLNYYKQFTVASYKIDLFHLFFEKSIELLKNNGKLGFITPNTYLNNKYIKPLRSHILNTTFIDELINYEDSVFIDAGVDVATLILNKSNLKNEKIKVYSSNKGYLKNIADKSQNDWLDNEDNFFNINDSTNFKIDISTCKKIEDFCSVTFGLQTKDKSTYVSDYKKESDWEECYTGKDISKYFLNKSSLYFKNNFKEVKAGGSWNMDIHHSKKIVVRQVGNPEPIAAFDKFGFATLNTMYSIVILDENWDYFYLLGIINSNLMKKYFLSNHSDGKQLFPKIKGYQLKSLPIKEESLKVQKPLIDKVRFISETNIVFNKLSTNFQNYLKQKFQLEKLSKKLQNWYTLEFGEFIKELNKAIKAVNKTRAKENNQLQGVLTPCNNDNNETSKGLKPLGERKMIPTLTKLDEMDWMEVFETKKTEAQALKTQIDKTDSEIDQMVYELYGLSEEEITIVEGS